MKKKLLATGSVLYIAACGMLFFGQNGQAYIDPSVITYLIQIVAGVAIAVGAALGFYFRKAKKKISKKLGIDENKNKEVESDEIELNPEEEKTEADSSDETVAENEE